MDPLNEFRYIQAYAKIIGVKEDTVNEYARKKGISALIDNASQLLTTKTQRDKHKAFVDLYRMSSSLINENPVLNSPEAVNQFMQSVMEHIHDKEAMIAVFLNTKNKVIDYEEISLGTINSSIIHPREVFRNAVINKANSIVLCHNHPSGDLTPSNEDRTTTKRLEKTGTILGIPVLDHLIISGIHKEDYFSFKEHGVLEQSESYRIKQFKQPSSVQESEFLYSSGVPLKVFVTNLGKYNEGELAGEWLSLPASSEGLQSLFKRIELDGKRYEEYFITDYETSLSGLNDHLSQYSNLEELNYLAAKLESLSPSELEHFQAALELDGAGEIRDLINLTENLDCFDHFPDVHSDEELGYYWAEESGAYDLQSMGNLSNYIDYDRLGQDIRLEEGGIYTDYGYIRSTGDTPYRFYENAQDIPEEYRFLTNLRMSKKQVQRMHTPPICNPLETAEKSEEQNYNMIDGLINNLNTLGEQEKKASIREQLKPTKESSQMRKSSRDKVGDLEV